MLRVRVLLDAFVIRPEISSIDFQCLAVFFFLLIQNGLLPEAQNNSELVLS